MIFYLIDPVKQLNKAKDSKRTQDFRETRTALDTYYNDHNCYPTTLSFGVEWKEGNTVYMKKVPQDPNCSMKPSSCYIYSTDTNTTCPQWHVLFGKLAYPPSANRQACALDSSCLPSNFALSGYNACDVGGNVDCNAVNLVSLPQENPPSPTPSPTLTSTPIPTISNTPISPTPTPGSPTPTITPGGAIYYCGCGNNHATVCNVSYIKPEGITIYANPNCDNQCGQPC